MKKEIWKDVKGYEGSYQVSDLGRVKSLARYMDNTHGSKSKLKERILLPRTDHDGRYIVVLYKSKKRKHRYIHQLVAETFLNHKVNGHHKVVNHIDMDKQNNCIDNLEIISQRENCSYIRENAASKYTGVFRSKNKWKSQIIINGKLIHLGTFMTELGAHETYQNKLKTTI